MVLLRQFWQSVDRHFYGADGEEGDQVAGVGRHDGDTEEPETGDEDPARHGSRYPVAACKATVFTSTIRYPFG